MDTEIETIWEDPKPNRNVPPIYIIISVNSRGLVLSLVLKSLNTAMEHQETQLGFPFPSKA